MKIKKSKRQFTMIALLSAAVAGAASAMPTVIDVSSSISVDTVWDSDTDDDGTIDQIYFIDEAVFVGDLTGATRPTLTIEPGTVIAASGSTTGTNGLDVGTLVVTRDGRLDAAGTALEPIVFTSVDEAEFIYNIDIDGLDGINDVKPDPIVDGGAWGGVIILGRAPINFYDSPTNNLGENSVEGFATNAAGDSILYGGNDGGDDSGVLRYASLRFGGFEFAIDEEINGLTMAGVGAGTQIDHIEVVGNTDDGFEWFGGTVNTSHLFALYCQDESFDLDEGHQGVHQFWFAVQSNFSDYGTEADGGNRTGAGVKTGEPLTLAKVYNATYVGAPDANDAFRLKDNYAGQFHNSIFTNIGDNLIRIDDTDTAGQVGVNLNFTNNLFNTPGSTPTHGGQPDEENALLEQTGNQTDVDPLLTTVGTNGDGEVDSIDPRPQAASPAWGGDLTPGAPHPVSYKGAFGADNWVSGWTYASNEGIVVNNFTPPAITVVNVGTGLDTDTTWDSDTNDDGIIDQIYFVDQAVFVGDLSGATRPTLTIEPGTVIALSGSTTGTNGLDVGTVVITRDGRIDAQGTVNSPIVFTSVDEAEFLYGIDIDGLDGITDFKPDPVVDGGAWGGVIILGNAPINFYDSETNNLGENSVEGFATNAAGDNILYGGSDPADNSGIFQYVSLRFGGFEFAIDEEINGLTMAGVGAGTQIDHVEVVGNTDDGFEWFGGTVNTSHLFALYCQDESFDLDEGHQGVHQYWFAVQSNFSDYGTEADGGNRTGAGVKTGEPLTLAKVFNATYIGAPDANDAFRLKDNYAGQFHNSIFTNQGDDLIRIDDTDTAAQVGSRIFFTNNIFGTPGDSETHGGQPAAEAAVLAQEGNVKDTDPSYSAVATNEDGEVVLIDPRPAMDGPAWGTTLTPGAPEVAPHRGAFGVENWARTWTYASANGLFVDSFLAPAGVEVVAVGDSIAVDTTWDSDTNDDGIVDRIYFMNQAVFVGDLTGATRPVLTIEPGTVIAASGSTTGTNGLDVGALVITRDGGIDADGEATNPIIFTSVADAEFLYGVDIDGLDGVNDVKQDPIIDGGAWGGVIILGRAPINFYDSPTNNLGENSVEGFATNAAGDSILYGGSDASDSSGSLSYASLRFGGFEFAIDEEINGLTMGGVGSGTSIHHVEVVGNTDDGFEWFGGTVNTSYLFALYCQDESFDLDEGHQGIHQFWFALQSNFSDYGTEADGGNRTGAGVKTGDPKTTAKVFNATYVGAPDANDAFRLKDNYAGQFHNSIFTEIGDNLIRIDDTDTAGQVGGDLRFTYNIFGTPGGDETHGGQPDEEALLLSQDGNVKNTNPLLSYMAKNEDGEVIVIDPRPSIDGGPAWGSDLLAGAPEQVQYRGAFGTELWTSTWTYASAEGIVRPGFSSLATPEATIITEGGGGEPTVVDVPNTIDSDVVWDSDSDGDGIVDRIYYVDQAVFVGDLTGATRPTLTIEPGTVVALSGSTTGTNGLDVGALVITRDGAIAADGDETHPIVFTSVAEAEYLYGIDVDGVDGINDIKPDPVVDGGAWGGVIILGRAPINFYDSETNNLGENSVEGFATNAAGDSILYGGSDASDSSGSLSYMSIRFGGFEFAVDEEINGLTMAGVGAGTSIHHVEVVGNTDDGFEWFGGTVNTSHLFALYCQDESFDLDEGHQGVHQYWFAIQSNFSDYGTEADGGNKTGAGVKTGDPKTTAKVFNATYIGAPDANDAFRLKDNYSGQFHNSIFINQGDDLVRIDDTDTADQVGTRILFTNNLFGTPGDVETHGGQPDAEAALLAQEGNVKDSNPSYSTFETNGDGEVVLIDPRPALDGPAWGTRLTGGAPEAAVYRGAFGTENWAQNWTYASANGFFADSFIAPAAIEVVSVNDAIAVDTTWDSDSDGDGIVDRIYYVDQAVFVGDLTGATRPTLTIEPGTVVALSGSTTGTNGLDVGALVITRDGAIAADGDETHPIVFTSVAEAEYLYGIDVDGVDGINDIKPDPIVDGGAWGGVIILGRAPINFYDSPTNNLGENSVEGFATNAAGDSILYGGSDASDSSGSLSYMSIRFGGFEFAADEEINGLTMGGVGSGTSIHHVEVVGNTDDGFEWFGGTVNTSYLFALYCQDESFDLDEGHQGIHQFWFALQSNFSDYGTEADGGNRTGAGVKTGDPKTTAKVFNATYVGAPDANDAFRLKDNYAGQFHNSIFTEIGDNLIRIDDTDTAGQVGGDLRFTYNIFGTPGGDETHGGQPDEEALLLSQDGNVKNTNPLLSYMAKNEDGEVIVIDPRPSIDGGPAWGSDLLAGAPEQVQYRGAFGTELWTSTWTYASAEGIVRPGFSELTTPEATIIIEVEGGAVLEVLDSSLDGDQFSITFVAEVGGSYKVTQAASLDGTFVDVPGAVVTEAEAQETVTFTVPVGADAYFFRIVEVVE